MRRPRTASLAVLAAVAGAATVGAFGSTAGASTGVVAKGTVEQQAAKILAFETAEQLPKVICPSGLKGKVGASIRCTVIPRGSTLRYPATVTVQSIHGSTANFFVQVGQAAGQGNKAEFCVDESKLAAATSLATTPAAYLLALEVNAPTIFDFQNTAPSKIVKSAATLVQASARAISTQNTSMFGTQSVIRAQAAVATFCGQKVNG